MRQQKGPHVFNELKAGAAEFVIANRTRRREVKLFWYPVLKVAY